MGRIVISENVTIDGVIQDPTGDGGFAHGGWFNEIGDEDRQGWAEVETGEALRAEALLLGRRTYDYLAARWPARTGVWADRLNSMPKYVVSSTLADPAWTNTAVLTGDVVNEVTRLKERPGRRDRRQRQRSARPHADRARPGRRAEAHGLPVRAR